jgi:hypothetical protein
MFEQREENILFTLEVRVERAAGIAGLCSDVFQSRSFKTIVSKEPFGGLQ